MTKTDWSRYTLIPHEAAPIKVKVRIKPRGVGAGR